MGGNDLLNGLKVVENSLLGPGLVGTFLSDLGAEVIKVESPSGDYIRQMTWPIVEGNSLLHLHIRSENYYLLTHLLHLRISKSGKP